MRTMREGPALHVSLSGKTNAQSWDSWNFPHDIWLVFLCGLSVWKKERFGSRVRFISRFRSVEDLVEGCHVVDFFSIIIRMIKVALTHLNSHQLITNAQKLHIWSHIDWQATCSLDSFGDVILRHHRNIRISRFSESQWSQSGGVTFP